MTSASFETLGWWLAIAVGASLISSAFYPVFSRGISELDASSRTLVRLVYAGSAPLIAALTIVLISQPGLASLFVPAHCHGDECGAHTPIYAQDSVVVLALAAVSTVVVFFLLLVFLWTLRRAHRQFQVINALANADRRGYKILDSHDLYACCVGLLKPRIMVSRGLISQLQTGELRVVLAHERAHAMRFDNLRALLLRWLTLFWLPATKRQICRENHADAEQACDQVAARQFGGPARVAAVIRKLSGLPPRACASQASGTGFDGGDAASRLLALEHGQNGGRLSAGYLKAFSMLSLVWVLQVYLFASVAHTLVEWMGV